MAGFARILVTPLAAAQIFCLLLVNAQIATPTGWNVPSPTLSPVDRANLAKNALDVLVQNISTTLGQPNNLDIRQSATFLATLAEYDYLTSGATYKSTVVSTFEKFSSVNPTFELGGGDSDAIRCGLEMLRISHVYPDQTDLLQTAEKIWDNVSPLFIDATEAATGVISSVNTSFSPICNGSSVEGAILFNPSNANINQVNGETIGPFIALSAHLFNATKDPRYSLAANQSIQFVKNHLSDGTMVYDSFNLSNCKRSAANFTYNNGYVIEGMSVYINVTNDRSSFAFLDELVKSLVLTSSWTRSDGIITEGLITDTAKVGPTSLNADWKAILIHALYTFLITGGGSASNISSLVRDYIAIQDNSIRNAASTQLGSAVVYSPSWPGPPLPVFLAAGQLAAAEVFNVALGLTQPSSSSASTTSISPTPTQSSSLSPKPKRSNAGAIVGGLIGGVLAVLVLVGLAIWLRRRRSRSINRDQLEIRQNTPRDTIVEPFTLTSSPAAVDTSTTPSMSYANGPGIGRSKPQRARYILSSSYSGGAASSSAEPLADTGNELSSSQPRVVQIDVDVLQQVLHGVNGVLARMDRVADDELQPPVYAEAVGRR